ncbi:helix-turn-helix domain-containing protein [Bacillus sp. HMF5848]|uniref:helix-turn-helix transcriptional regulator n=1 Tax=Bacillus sp. HMF5848 TaxID=2495421 RepID=UPI000F794A85|nr:helix-turn-helix transcriptional regulator [Bacillus sp. HMF5848]RSK26250.1 helix-turn-helix domain-containing protein [Bacillus sp. HMF5848]
MPENESYTTEEIAQILKVSKLTVYDLIKKGKLPAYRVGRQMRVDASDLEEYKNKEKRIRKSEGSIVKGNNTVKIPQQNSRSVIISGQDNCLDLLTKYLEKEAIGIRPLRSYVGSLDSLITMYKGEADIVSTHLYDSETGEFNIPYIRRILVSNPLIVVNLITRQSGFYVAKGNPKKISKFKDLLSDNVKLINREKGSGARIFLDEKLREEGICPADIKGYLNEETSHLGVGGIISKGVADVGIGTEKVAKIVGVDFIPLINERYDLVMLKSEENKQLISTILRILQSGTLKEELASIGYDVSNTGNIMYEQ